MQIKAPPQTISAVIAFPAIWVFENTIRLCSETKDATDNHKLRDVGGGIFFNKVENRARVDGNLEKS